MQAALRRGRPCGERPRFLPIGLPTGPKERRRPACGHTRERGPALLPQSSTPVKPSDDVAPDDTLTDHEPETQTGRS